MKAIFIERRKSDGTIWQVISSDEVKPAESEWEGIVKSANEAKDGLYEVELRYISPENEELFEFLLGVDGYKKYARLSTICEKIKDLNDMLEGISTDVYDIENQTESMAREIKELKKSFGE